MKQIIFIVIALATSAFSKELVETRKTRAQNVSKSDSYALDTLLIQSTYYPHSYFLFENGPFKVPFVELSRNFQKEILEFIDREYVEMKNDEN